ncbi:MAG: hypothetical protein ACK53Y_04585 [bacterium]
MVLNTKRLVLSGQALGAGHCRQDSAGDASHCTLSGPRSADTLRLAVSPAQRFWLRANCRPGAAYTS